MPLVSVTRLRLRSFVYLPGFIWYSLASTRRAAATEGFVGGELAAEEKSLVFWTLTAWRDAAAMKSFRNGGAHLDAMKHLPKWCSEASYGHWDHEHAAIPSWEEAHRQMRELGKPTKVKFPSPLHTEGRTCTDRVPKSQRTITPRT
jgi:hypothetical protein